jgi:hypothetical protein
MADSRLPSTTPWQPGDIVVESGTSLISRVIQWATFGPSHVAVVAMLNKAAFRWNFPWLVELRKRVPERLMGRCLLFESDNQPNEPDAILGKILRGVQCHELSSLDRTKGRIWRLPIRRALDYNESRDLTSALLSRHGQRYDFDGALLAGTHWLKRLLWWRAADRGTVFCDELGGSVLEAAISSRPRFPIGTNWGQQTPRQFVRLLRESGVYGDLERVR